MTEVYLLLGSNLGERITNLNNAVRLIASRCGKIQLQSSIYETEAWGLKEQNSFLNMAVVIKTTLAPKDVLIEVKTIERELGRTDTTKWGPRLIDIDILLYGESIIELDDLKIPHPFISERKFTLLPLNEIARDVIHPVYNLT